MGPAWSAVEPECVRLSWTHSEVQTLRLVLGDMYEINRLAAFNLLQSVAWSLSGDADMASVLARSAEEALPDGLASDMYTEGLALTTRLPQGRAHGGALLIAMVFARCVQGRGPAASAAVLSRADKASQLQRNVSSHSSVSGLQGSAASEAVFYARLLTTVEARV